eukprot:7253403-Prymnesium_polylepis.3
MLSSFSPTPRSKSSLTLSTALFGACERRDRELNPQTRGGRKMRGWGATLRPDSSPWRPNATKTASWHRLPVDSPPCPAETCRPASSPHRARDAMLCAPALRARQLRRRLGARLRRHPCRHRGPPCGGLRPAACWTAGRGGHEGAAQSCRQEREEVARAGALLQAMSWGLEASESVPQKSGQG